MSYRNYSTANGYIVDPSGNGDFATVQAAITAATSGKTIFIKPGLYIENLTLKAGVDLTAFIGSAVSASVIIAGNATFSTAGFVSISGIRLQTNASNILTVSGSAASFVFLNNCYFNCADTTGIIFSSSDATSQINLSSCAGNLGTTGIALFTSTSAGLLTINYSKFTNTGASSTANTVSVGNLSVKWSTFTNPITSSGTATFNANFSLCLFLSPGYFLYTAALIFSGFGLKWALAKAFLA